MKKFYKIICVTLLLLTGINALIAGVLFIIDPSGSKMGMSTDYLKASPFSSFLIPGIILFIVNGVLNVCAALYLIYEIKYSVHWAFIQGILLMGWILIQIYLVRDVNVLHIIMFSVGVFLSLFSLLLLRLN